MAPYMTPPRYSSDPSSPRLNSDPLLAGSPVVKTKSIPSDGTVGGFPVKFLDMVVCVMAMQLLQYWTGVDWYTSLRFTSCRNALKNF
jgi:hypothetical protein